MLQKVVQKVAVATGFTSSGAWADALRGVGFLRLVSVPTVKSTVQDVHMLVIWRFVILK